VWFAPAAEALPAGSHKDGLKAVTSAKWTEMLDQVNCKILSVVESEHVDAYLLSESSMFVFPHKLILKTCGTTTLLFGLHRMLEIASGDAGFPSQSAGPGSIKTKNEATPYRVFYSRKNFLYPDKQHGPHRSWKEEVKYLDHMFVGGSAYMVGKMNGDHWYLYLTTPNMTLTPPHTPESQIAGTETKSLYVPANSGYGQSAVGTDDETLEVLMTDLDPENAKQFYLAHASAVAEDKYAKRAREARREAVESLGSLNSDDLANSSTSLGATTNGSNSGHDETFDVFSNTSSDHGAFTPDNDVEFLPDDLTTEGHTLGTVVSEACGLSDVYPTTKYPDARVDAYLFTPCGFSANGVVPAPDLAGAATHYFTVHVTPEPQCSYASFETNVPGRQSGRETVEVIEHVVSIFKPGRFSVTLFEAKGDSAEVRGEADDVLAKAESGRLRSARMDRIRGYRRVERIVHDFDGYELVFRYYERDDWDGRPGPRLGEMDG
jgi:S-adenosylmethionine decarboxylase